MQRYNLSLALDEDFLLLAIHSSLEEYKLAYLINKHLNLRFQRKKKDLDFFNKSATITYPIYEYSDTVKDDLFYLLSNVCKTITEKTVSAGSLFDTEYEEKTHYLVHEFKQADFLIKIITDETQFYENEFLKKLSIIPGIVAAHKIDQNKLKSKQNLNFDSCH
tara:strand:+ start:6749 stop:7237 length:489 start_codon:yes stop_codon:yes gene_type:complete